MTLPSEATALLEWRLIDLFESRSFQRRAFAIDELAARGTVYAEWALTIKALLLIEMRERPAPARLLEWVLGWVPGKRTGRLTKGPFQIRAAPFRFEDAVAEVQHRLLDGLGSPPVTRHDLRRLADQWNGTSTRLHGAAIAYSEALEMAEMVISRWPSTAWRRPWVHDTPLSSTR